MTNNKRIKFRRRESHLMRNRQCTLRVFDPLIEPIKSLNPQKKGADVRLCANGFYNEKPRFEILDQGQLIDLGKFVPEIPVVKIDVKSLGVALGNRKIKDIFQFLACSSTEQETELRLLYLQQVLENVTEAIRAS